MSKVSIRSIINATSQFYDIPVDQLLSRTRVRRISRVRQVAHYIAIKDFKYSYTKVGNYFGFDHTTVVHSVRAINKRGLPKEHRDWIRVNAEHRDSYSKQLIRESVERMHSDGAA
jgi:chromosomal replication initiation ATPase DnaA